MATRENRHASAPPHHRLVSVVVILVGALAGVNPSSASAQAPRVVDVHTADYAFTAPDTIQAGVTTFHLINHGPSEHHLTIFALPGGMPLATFDRLMRADSVQGTGIEPVGGPEGPADDATEAWATLELAPGRYVLTCLLPLPDGSGTHRSRGMFRALTVVPAAGRPARMPHADVVVRMTDYAFDLPATVPAGRQLVRFENAGVHAHLALIARLVPGRTLADMAAWQKTREGPNPSIYVGGVSAMARGRAAVAQLDLEPGHYFIVCIATDGTMPKAHYEVGMLREFTVIARERGR